MLIVYSAYLRQVIKRSLDLVLIQNMKLSNLEYEKRIKALAERSSYVENVLRHALIAELSSVVWGRNSDAALQVLNAEVDNAGFDLVLGLGTQVRYIQLKQTHDQKVPRHCSVRLSFSALPGSCVVLMSHTISELRLTQFRFFGGPPGEPMESITELRLSKLPGRRDASGERKTRVNYRDVSVRSFAGPYSSIQLLDVLFPGGLTT